MNRKLTKDYLLLKEKYDKADKKSTNLIKK